MVTKNTKTDKLAQPKVYAKNDTSYSSFWLYNRTRDMNSEHFKDSFVNFYDDKDLLSEFNPTTAKNIISFWSEKDDTIFDPFSGRTRLIVSHGMSRNYVGTEVSKDVINYMGKKLSENNIKSDKNTIDLIHDDCLNIDKHYPNKKFDMIFSCPPYWNLEKYESCNGQLSDINSYNEFLFALKKRLDVAVEHLADEKYMCIVIGDFRKAGKYHTIHSDLLQLMATNNSLSLHDVVIIQNIPFHTSAFYFGNVKHVKKTSKAHEYLLVWKKKLTDNNKIRKPRIKSKKYTLEDMKEKAKSRGGKCLSEKFINMSKKLKWQCSEGHVWEAEPSRIMTRNQWCYECNKIIPIRPKLSFEELCKVAEQHGGKLLSEYSEYKDTSSKLKWRCQYGHEWITSVGSVKHSKNWCPKCNVSYGENISRYLFEAFTKKKFPTKKPEWLINTTGNLLELDGYNEELNIAFEYNGVQHYKKNDRFHKSNKALIKQKERDVLKSKLCKERGVSLLIIPYTLGHDLLEDFIKDFLLSNNIKIDIIKKVKLKNVNISKNKNIDKFNKKVVDAGYTLVSDYNGYLQNITVKCSKGHKFVTTPRSLFRNNGCPVCSGHRKSTTAEIIDLCRTKNIKFLDEKYVSGKRLNVECVVCGHVSKLRHADIVRDDFECTNCVATQRFSDFIKPFDYSISGKFNGAVRPLNIVSSSGDIISVTPRTIYINGGL